MSVDEGDDGSLDPLSSDELEKFKNDAEEFFDDGFKIHTFETIFRLKDSAAEVIDIVIISRIDSSNEIRLKYLKTEKKLIFALKDEEENKEASGEVDFLDVDLISGKWHEIVYRLGKYNLKLWLDCKVQKNSNGDRKTVYEFPMEFSKSDSKTKITFGNDDDVDYRNAIRFHGHPSNIGKYTFRFYEGDIWKNEQPKEKTYFNDAEDEGTFHVLNEFSSKLTKCDSRGVYYKLNQCTAQDVTEFFEDGILRDHTFEMTYRITKFPESAYSYYLFLLNSSNTDQISINLKDDRNILGVYIASLNDKILETEFWVEQIYDDSWHKLKYALKNNTFSLWIDGEEVEDYKGRSSIPLTSELENVEQFLWYDTYLMLSERGNGFHRELEIEFQKLEFHGNAITTTNSEISFKHDKERNGVLNTFCKILGIK